MPEEQEDYEAIEPEQDGKFITYWLFNKNTIVDIYFLFIYVIIVSENNGLHAVLIDYLCMYWLTAGVYGFPVVLWPVYLTNKIELHNIREVLLISGIKNLNPYVFNRQEYQFTRS